ncbi:MAG: 4Fe-4S binding protein [Planctomycetes bacterium]|nr:4Fe-4S binding protein [Planctomycetota bacterium]MCC8115813.1 4Fe-4S binding protein [Planctomycetota bacterium]MCD7895785.1 4Fe-4S binding protein [Planctomycetaceae bacterium]
MVTCDAIAGLAREFIEQTPLNVISPKIALNDDVVGLRLFEAPVFGFGNPDDDLFADFAAPAANVVLRPFDWLVGARTIISYFLPFTDRVKEGNSRDLSYPSAEWLHARIDGHHVGAALSSAIKSFLEEHGHTAVVPVQETAFTADYVNFTSNWSERHIAFVCGLGTFGLSRGIITEKGMAGRFGSVLTTLELPYTERKYRDVYEYCTRCGACLRNCPAQAISLENGKARRPCKAFLNAVLAEHTPYYGCGKCQVRVPCANEIPPGKNRKGRFPEGK